MRNFLYKRKIIYIILIVVGIIALTGTTYAIFTTTTTQEGTNTINTLKCLELTFSNQSDAINLENTYPMSDERGKKNTPYTFTLTNKCGAYVEYSLGLAINTSNTLENKYIKTMFSLKNEDGEAILLTDRLEGKDYEGKKTYIFRNDGLENNASKDYKLTLWIDESLTNSQMNSDFKGNIILNIKPIKNEGQIYITVDLNGGNLRQELNEIYREGMKVKLPTPAKAGYHFDKWEVISGGVTIDENNCLVVGKSNIKLKAIYKGGITLTLELNGGSTTQTLKDDYGQGETITLINPTKNGYEFSGWKITSGNGTLNGNILTMNTESVVLEAIWKKIVTITVDLNGGSTTQTFKNTYYPGEKMELVTPTKLNTTFIGWEVISGGITIEDNSFIFGTNDVSIMALWQESWTFNFTGSAQTFTIPHNGVYKLETWGAQGGSYNTTYYGGYGGYSTGEIYLNKNDVLNIYVGGMATSAQGGFNGGGTGATITGNSGGGGATHIATVTGVLSSLSSKTDNILIVSGGGGGSFYETGTGGAQGGAGGGYIGNSGLYKNRSIPYGGTQTAGGTCADSSSLSGSFGKGGTWTDYSTGGGGGYYGGAAGGTDVSDHNDYGTGSGGSGYIGNSELSNKSMYCYNCESSSNTATKTVSTTCVSSTPTTNCAKQGNGYAKITYVS